MPLPEDPALAATAAALDDVGHWAEIVDIVRVHDAAGRLAGTALISKPEAGMAVLTTIAVGQITTRGRTGVTALGEEVNEAARIEACATGGLVLASRPLVERLARQDAADLGLDPDRVTYTALGSLATATEKARRDAPAIAVCEM